MNRFAINFTFTEYYEIFIDAQSGPAALEEFERLKANGELWDRTLDNYASESNGAHRIALLGKHGRVIDEMEGQWTGGPNFVELSDSDVQAWWDYRKLDGVRV